MIGVDLELGALMNDPHTLALLPALLICFYISQMVPAVLLKRWYSWKETVGAGVLLSANLSLAIAAAEVSYKFGIINGQMRGALILAAVISCFISPVLFGRIFPKQATKKLTIGIVGANHITLPVSLDLQREGYDVALYSAQAGTEEPSRFPHREIRDLSQEALTEAGLFERDVVVLGTIEDDVNLKLAQAAMDAGTRRVIVRVEDPDRREADIPEGVEAAVLAERRQNAYESRHRASERRIAHHPS